MTEVAMRKFGDILVAECLVPEPLLRAERRAHAQYEAAETRAETEAARTEIRKAVLAINGHLAGYVCMKGAARRYNVGR
jgi:hypothetical protein